MATEDKQIKAKIKKCLDFIKKECPECFEMMKKCCPDKKGNFDPKNCC